MSIQQNVSYVGSYFVWHNLLLSIDLQPLAHVIVKVATGDM